jgi:hypothetical protein
MFILFRTPFVVMGIFVVGSDFFHFIKKTLILRADFKNDEKVIC